METGVGYSSIFFFFLIGACGRPGRTKNKVWSKLLKLVLERIFIKRKKRKRVVFWIWRFCTVLLGRIL